MPKTNLTGSDSKNSPQGKNRLRTSGRTITSTPNARGAKGIYNYNPSPGLDKYPASKGPGDIDEKFAETGVGDANKQSNQIRMAKGVRKEGKAPLATTSNMMTKKNPYRTSGKVRQ